MFIDFYSICSYILYDTMSLLAVWTLMSQICNCGSIDGHSTWWSAMLQACHKSNKNQWCILPNDNLFWGRGGNYPSPVDLELFSEPCWRFARATRLQPLWLHHYCIFYYHIFLIAWNDWLYHVMVNSPRNMCWTTGTNGFAIDFHCLTWGGEASALWAGVLLSFQAAMQNDAFVNVW